MKKELIIVGVLIIGSILSGCHMSHEWQEATCTVPKTCSVGGETEGEPLGHTWVNATCAEAKYCSVCGETEGVPLEHTWVDATCAEAKHCSVCGETEGEPLEHILTEANYQQPAVCEVCGETVGEPLQAYFEKYGLECNVELNKEYSFVTPCHDNEEYATEGKITFSDYEVFESDEAHEALDGYEWHAVTINGIFDDDNAYNYGYLMEVNSFDYYDEAYNDDENAYDEENDVYILNYNGVDYNGVKDHLEILQRGWDDHTYTVKVRYYLPLPKGYDGGIIAVFSTYDWEYVRDMPDNTLYFRLK